MSSQPDVPLDQAPPTRHSYDTLFGDEPAPAAAQALVDPVSYDDEPGDAEVYLPPAARPERAEAPQAEQPGSEPAESAHQEPAAPEPSAPSWEGDPQLAARAARPVDTGRLYHSAGVTDPSSTGAIPAIPAALVAPAIPAALVAPAISAAPVAPAIPPVPATAVAGNGSAPSAVPVPTTVAASQPAEPAPPRTAERMEGVAPVKTPTQARPAPAAAPGTAGATSDRGLTYLGVVTVVGVPTLLVGLVQAAIWHRVGWLTGLVLVITSCYAALTVRRSDASAAVVVPPLAFLVTILVAGQLTLAEGGSLLVREGFVLLRGLAENAPWIFAATLLAAVIVLVRRRRG